MMLEFSPLLELALRRSAEWHRNHCRKGGEIPYITHPFAVALILKEHGVDEEFVIAAALLHDVVEDTDCSLEDLRTEFPAEVVEMVSEMTEEKFDTNGQKRSWQQRKEEHVKKIANSNRLSRTVFLADKLHNFSTMVFDLDHEEDIWHRFGLPPKQLIEQYRIFVRQIRCENKQMETLVVKCLRMLDYLAEKAIAFEVS